MADAFVTALVGLLSVQHFSFLLLGVGLGLVVGVLPALGSVAGMSLLLPFIYGLDQTSALALMVGLLAVVPTGDTFTSITLGVPGSIGSQATVLDGFQLAKKGEAARALSAAFFSSLLGGLFGAIILTGFIIVARPVILSLGAAELFMLCILGLSMVGSLSGRSLLKGLGACGLGLLLGSVGGAPATGEFRLSFGTSYLTDPLPVAVVALGIFAVGEIIDLLRQDRAIAEHVPLGSGWMKGIKDTLRHHWLVWRCSGIGAFIGVLPGLGGSVSDWLAYGQAVQTAKDRSQFGKGDIRGVIAPEAANNATTGGGLVPTILFGIPGSGSTAIFLGGMALIGIQPGINMIERDLGLTYTIIWSLAIANVLGAAACLFLAKPVAKLCEIRFLYLAPFLLTIILFAGFQSTREWGDLVALIVIGGLGVYMRRFGWPRPAFLIGFVLSGSIETYLYQSVQIYDWTWIERPGVLIVGALTIMSVIAGVRLTGQLRSSDSTTAVTGTRGRQMAFAGFLVAAALVGVYDATQQSFLAQVFPLTAAAVLFLTATVTLIGIARAPAGHPLLHDEDLDADSQRIPSEVFILWLIGFLALCLLLGFVLGVFAFFVLFLGRYGVRWWRILLMGAAATGFVVAGSWFLVLDLPQGLLQEMVRLPWPLR